MSTRVVSNILFGVAIGCAALLKTFAIPESLVWLAIVSVVVAMILTNLMWIRSIGLTGVGGLSLVYVNLSGSPIPGTTITVLVTILSILAILLAIYSDFPESSKGKTKSDEA
jgi:apolipoprotein N-acyltransferase